MTTTDQQRKEKPYWNPYVAGIVLGCVLFASYVVAGAGLGGSGGLFRVSLALEKIAAPATVDTNAYLAKAAGGYRSVADILDHRMFWMMLGVIAGGLTSGLLAGRAGLETNRGPKIGTVTRWSFALIGGILVGYGARLARGCTSGQALSGGALLAAGSWAFMFAVFAGGYLLAYPVRRLWSDR